MRISNALTLLAATLLASTLLVAQQDKSKRPSPPGQASITLANGTKITIDYSRPHVKDPKTGAARKIMGGVVPYGEVWRTGANEATTFVTTGDVTINGVAVPTGSYTLFTLPSEGTWKLIISKKTGEWGIPYPGEGDDLARVDMNKTTMRKGPIEQFTISLDQKGTNEALLKLAWENTEVSANVKGK